MNPQQIIDDAILKPDDATKEKQLAALQNEQDLIKQHAAWLDQSMTKRKLLLVDDAIQSALDKACSEALGTNCNHTNLQIDICMYANLKAFKEKLVFLNLQ